MHCGAPIALIDPDGVAKTVHELTIGQASVSPATQEQTSLALSNAQLDAFLDQGHSDENEGNQDLLAIGVAAIGAALGVMLLAR